MIGKVTDGLDVVSRIGLLGDPATEMPTQPVVVDRMRVAASRDDRGRRARGGRGDAVRITEAATPPATRARAGATRSDAVDDDFVVVLGAHSVDTDARTVECPDWERGLGASLRCGLASLSPKAEAAVVILADGPDLAPTAMTASSRPGASAATTWSPRPTQACASTPS